MFIKQTISRNCMVWRPTNKQKNCSNQDDPDVACKQWMNKKMSMFLSGWWIMLWMNK